MPQTDDTGLSLVIDLQAAQLILEGLSLLPYGRVKNLLESLQAATSAHWNTESLNE